MFPMKRGTPRDPEHTDHALAKEVGDSVSETPDSLPTKSRRSISAADQRSMEAIRQSLLHHVPGIAELSTAEAMFVYVEALDTEKTLPALLLQRTRLLRQSASQQGL